MNQYQYVKSIMVFHNQGQIQDALRRCQNNPNMAIEYLANLPRPPNIKHDRGGWFKYFDPLNCGSLSQAEIVNALYLSFGSDLRTVNFEMSVANIWSQFIPAEYPDVKISLEVFIEPEGLGETIAEYIAPIYLQIDEILLLFRDDVVVPRQHIHDVLMSVGGDKGKAVTELQRFYPLKSTPSSAAASYHPVPQHNNLFHQQHHQQPQPQNYNSQKPPPNQNYSSGHQSSYLPPPPQQQSAPVFVQSVPVHSQQQSQPPQQQQQQQPQSSWQQQMQSFIGKIPGMSSVGSSQPPPPPQQQQQQQQQHVSAGYSSQQASLYPTSSYSSGGQGHSYSPSGPVYRPAPNIIPATPAPPFQPIPPRSQTTQRALLVGCNYTGTSAELKGCANDVLSIKSLLTRTYGWSDSSRSMRILSDGNSSNMQPTKQNIMDGLAWLVEGVMPGDALFFHFSGHGSQQPDPHGVEEDGMNEVIMPVDYARSGVITDDTISQTIIQTLPDGVRLTVIMDCCHSGTDTWNPSMRRFDEETNPYHSLGDVTLFSGCMDEGTSCDVQSAIGAGGAMTMAFVSALQRNPHPTYDQLLEGLLREMSREGYQQRPQLSSTQEFDVGRPFLMNDALPNSNCLVGRTMRKKFKVGGDNQSMGHQMQSMSTLLTAMLFSGATF